MWQDAHEMLHVLMTTLEEEIPARAAATKPSHASLLDISNLGRDQDEDSEDDEEEEDTSTASAHCDNPSRFGLRRGMSLPPESRVTRDARDREDPPAYRDTQWCAGLPDYAQSQQLYLTKTNRS